MIWANEPSRLLGGQPRQSPLPAPCTAAWDRPPRNRGQWEPLTLACSSTNAISAPCRAAGSGPGGGAQHHAEGGLEESGEQQADRVPSSQTSASPWRAAQLRWGLRYSGQLRLPFCSCPSVALLPQPPQTIRSLTRTTAQTHEPQASRAPGQRGWPPRAPRQGGASACPATCPWLAPGLWLLLQQKLLTSLKQTSPPPLPREARRLSCLCHTSPLPLRGVVKVTISNTVLFVCAEVMKFMSGRLCSATPGDPSMSAMLFGCSDSPGPAQHNPSSRLHSLMRLNIPVRQGCHV